MPLFYQNLATIFDYLPSDSNIVIAGGTENALEDRIETISDYYRTRKINFDKLKVKVKDYLPLPPDLLYLNFDEVKSKFSNYNNLTFDLKNQGNFDYDIKAVNDFYKASLALKNRL